MFTHASDDMDETPQDQDRISVAQTLVRMGVILAASVLFNFYPEKVGVIQSATDPSSFTPLLAPEFQSYLFWLNLWWGLDLSLRLVHLIRRRWTVATRWADIVLRLLNVLLLGWMVLGVPFITVLWVSVLVKLVLAVVCTVTLVEAGKQCDRLLDGTRTVIQWKEG